MPGQTKQKLWTGAEVKQLTKYVSQGMTSHEIAKRFNRSVDSVRQKISALKLRRPKAENATDFTIRLSGELYDRLEAEAKRLLMSKAFYFRRAIEHELERTKNDT